MIGDEIRAEGKRLYAAGEINLSKLGGWLKAADFADSQQNGADPELEVMAEALRAYNIRHHPLPPWEEAEPYVKKIWLSRAADHLEELRQARERSDRILENGD